MANIVKTNKRNSYFKSKFRNSTSVFGTKDKEK